jgi:hypothetical protein
MPYALCYFLIISDKGSCSLQENKKGSLKIARRKETGKNSDESVSKVGFLRSANVGISSCNPQGANLAEHARFQLIIDGRILYSFADHAWPTFPVVLYSRPTPVSLKGTLFIPAIQKHSL